jgi:hypothetical protein
MKQLLTMAAFAIAFTACASTQGNLEPAEPAVEGEAQTAPEADSKTEEISEGSEATSEGSEEKGSEAAPKASTKKEQTDSECDGCMGPPECDAGEVYVEPYTRGDGSEVEGHCRKKPKGKPE